MSGLAVALTGALQANHAQHGCEGRHYNQISAAATLNLLSRQGFWRRLSAEQAYIVTVLRWLLMYETTA